MSRGMSKFRITNTAPAAREPGATTFGDYASSSRGSSEPNSMAPAIIEKIKDHPCFSRESHLYFAGCH
ncbi:nitrogenase cofactor biosynthesis protein NifB, partial [Rhizobium ruizarguesonis]